MAIPNFSFDEVDQRGSDRRCSPEGAHEGEHHVLDLGGDVDPSREPDQDHPADRRRDDHRVDRLAALLLPVDVLEVEPERELVERQPRPDPEERRR